MGNIPTGNPALNDQLAAHEKIKTIEELGEIARSAQARGRKVALCHGVFDLVHLGHIRHIQAARNEGDVVMVTITADRYVNKGPGRPIFPENMRAEMLASLASVDWVGINHTSSAEPILDTVRPDIYVKGSDYENPEDDVTGKIRSERDVVERHGGRIVFTRDGTFSSSSLVNRYFDIYDPPLRDYLQKVREGGGADRLLKLIDKVQDMHVGLVGDTIIDEYQYVTALGKASKENIVATLFKSGEQFAGGVIAAANHVASFCKSVEVVTTLGGNDYPEEFIRAHVRPNVTLTPIRLQGRPTTRKSRYVELGYLHKLFEVYTMDDTPLDEVDRKEIDRITTERVRSADVVIATDFGHGMIAASTIDTLIANSRFLAVNAQSNSGNHGYNLITRYPRADYICIDAPEARLHRVRDRGRPARQDRLPQHDHHARLLRLLPLLVENRRHARPRLHQDRRRHRRRGGRLPDDHRAADRRRRQYRGRRLHRQRGRRNQGRDRRPPQLGRKGAAGQVRHRVAEVARRQILENDSDWSKMECDGHRWCRLCR